MYTRVRVPPLPALHLSRTALRKQDQRRNCCFIRDGTTISELAPCTVTAKAPSGASSLHIYGAQAGKYRAPSAKNSILALVRTKSIHVTAALCLDIAAPLGEVLLLQPVLKEIPRRVDIPFATPLFGNSQPSTEIQGLLPERRLEKLGDIHEEMVIVIIIHVIDVHQPQRLYPLHAVRPALLE